MLQQRLEWLGRPLVYLDEFWTEMLRLLKIHNSDFITVADLLGPSKRGYAGMCSLAAPPHGLSYLRLDQPPYHIVSFHIGIFFDWLYNTDKLIECLNGFEQYHHM